ncbi:MAG: MotA/TolQ/ExbB proton channel family protein [Candidatus Hydrogenedentes bacterium]|nr:MotA/TolQ/ExbB proton channel family protein [Candidatus Hydrogenedentota bacterium]
MSWLGMLYEGGWVMVPLALCSVLGLAIILERFFSLKRSKIFPPDVLNLLSKVTNEKDLESLYTTCKYKTAPLPVLIRESLNVRNEPKEIILEHVQFVGRTQMTNMERGLALLQIIAVVSPLLGLLGTVLGMVDIFNAVTKGGLGNPQMLAQGISKALITTVVGLIIAIPSLVAYHLYVRRVEELGMELQDILLNFIARLKSIRN